MGMENRDEFVSQFDVPQKIHEILFKNIEKRLKRQVVVIRCPIECTCFGVEGIVAIKRALKKGLELSTDDFVVKIKLEAAPRYILTLSTLKPKEGKEKIQSVIDVITKELEKCEGNLKVKEKPATILSKDPRHNEIKNE